MKKVMLISIMVMVLVGCAEKPMETGFLSDYSKLQEVSATSYRYTAPGNPLAEYSKFIIEPVQIRFHVGSETEKAEPKVKLSKEDRKKIKDYMRQALVDAIDDRYEVVNRPGAGVARMRVAITDLKKSRIAQNTLPLTKLVGTGLGGASVEAELVDSVTNKQLGALVESQVGERLSLDGYSTWGDAKGVMDRWAKRFRMRLDEAHGY